MKIYKGKYLSDVYKDILNDLYNNPEYVCKPRDLEIREILNCVIEVEEPNFNLCKNEIRSSPEKYICAELLWYFSGTKNCQFIENYASMWTQLKNDKNEVNSAYGYLIFNEENQDHYTQYEWALNCLKKDKDSRQAFMHFNKPYHQYDGNKDQVCTLVALFHIRDNKLNMTLTMRSNDVIRGFAADFVFFNVLHQQMYLHLKEYYPKLKMGTYTHISHSMHLYSRHYELVEKMLKYKFEQNSLPLLNTSIVNQTGLFKTKYFRVFHPVIKNNKMKDEKTDNDLLNFCINKIKE